MFDNETKIVQAVEVWIMGMERYFEVNNYSNMEKNELSIYHLNGRATIWWEHLKNMKDIGDMNIRWGKFKKFQKKIPIREKI